MTGSATNAAAAIKAFFIGISMFRDPHRQKPASRGSRG
jgi:hypothetical protein